MHILMLINLYYAYLGNSNIKRFKKTLFGEGFQFLVLDSELTFDVSSCREGPT